MIIITWTSRSLQTLLLEFDFEYSSLSCFFIGMLETQHTDRVGIDFLIVKWTEGWQALISVESTFAFNFYAS